MLPVLTGMRARTAAAPDTAWLEGNPGPPAGVLAVSRAESQRVLALAAEAAL